MEYMDLNSALDKIENAVYGEEVRGAIYSGLKANANEVLVVGERTKVTDNTRIFVDFDSEDEEMEILDSTDLEKFNQNINYQMDKITHAMDSTFGQLTGNMTLLVAQVNNSYEVVGDIGDELKLVFSKQRSVASYNCKGTITSIQVTPKSDMYIYVCSSDGIIREKIKAPASNVVRVNVPKSAIVYLENLTSTTWPTSTIVGGYSPNDISSQLDNTYTKNQTDSLIENSKNEVSKVVDESVSELDMRIDALYKLNEGITYSFVDDESTAYSKKVLNGAKLCDIKSIGGKSLVWNQLFDITGEKLSYSANATYRIPEFQNNELSLRKRKATTTIIAMGVPLTEGHKYYISFDGKSHYANEDYSETYTPYFCVTASGVGGSRVPGVAINLPNTNTWHKHSQLFNVSSDNVYLSFRMASTSAIGTTISVKNVKLFDLTINNMENASIEEIEKIFSSGFYSYSDPTIIHAKVNSVEFVGINKATNIIDDWEQKNINDESPAGTKWEDMKLGYNSSRITLKNLIPVSKGKIYFSIENEFKIWISYFDENGRYFGGTDSYTPWTSSGVATVDASHFIGITLKKADNTSITPSDIDRAKLSIRQDKNEYVPYMGSKVSVPSMDLWSAGSYYDECDFESKKLIKRIGRVDLGALPWQYSEADARFFCNSDTPQLIQAEMVNVDGLLSDIYLANDSPIAGTGIDKTICVYNTGTNLKYIFINDFDYTDPTGLREHLNGHYLYYQKMEPETFNITDELDIFAVETGGTITFNQVDDTKHIPIYNKEEYVVKLSEVLA